MYEKKTHEFCSEFYTVEKTIQVVVTIDGESQTIRIDALKEGATGRYSTKAYRQEHLAVQSAYSQSKSSFDRVMQDYHVWVNYDLPWTNGDNADAILNQALGFLKERCSE